MIEPSPILVSIRMRASLMGQRSCRTFTFLVFVMFGANLGRVCIAEGRYPPAPNNPAAPIQTSSPIYGIERTPAGHAVSIPFIYTNGTGKKDLPTCHGVHLPVLEKWVPSAWRRVGGQWLPGDWVVAYEPVVLAGLGLHPKSSILGKSADRFLTLRQLPQD